jgi:[ribosomal protein S18]-alanine N-acetyltransferase
MRSHDLDEVVAIERVCFTLPWSRGAFLYEMEQNRVARCWVLREEARVIAYVCLWEIGEEVHVTNIAVRPESRRKGLGRTLLTSVLDDARQRRLRVIGLEVRPSNQEAIGLYDSFGFKVVGRRKGYYYDTGEDALVMELQLETATADGGGGNRRSG